MLIKRTERQSNSLSRRGMLAASLTQSTGGSLDRRAFLRRSGLAAGSLAALGALPLTGVRQAKAGPPPAAGAAVTIRKSVCTHCAVGCTVLAEVSNGVWIGQEPAWDSPINRGSHCAKGASVRELVHSERRLRYPMKLAGGQWTKITWDQAVNEIELAVRATGEERNRPQDMDTSMRAAEQVASERMASGSWVLATEATTPKFLDTRLAGEALTVPLVAELGAAAPASKVRVQSVAPQANT